MEWKESSATSQGEPQIKPLTTRSNASGPRTLASLVDSSAQRLVHQPLETLASSAVASQRKRVVSIAEEPPSPLPSLAWPTEQAAQSRDTCDASSSVSATPVVAKLLAALGAIEDALEALGYASDVGSDVGDVELTDAVDDA